MYETDKYMETAKKGLKFKILPSNGLHSQKGLSNGQHRWNMKRNQTIPLCVLSTYTSSNWTTNKHQKYLIYLEFLLLLHNWKKFIGRIIWIWGWVLDYVCMLSPNLCAKFVILHKQFQHVCKPSKFEKMTHR